MVHNQGLHGKPGIYIDTSFITGIGNVQGRMLVLVDIEALMNTTSIDLTGISSASADDGA